jgi:antitoxin component HigA of HigAB toxin-antitoxin module
MQLKKLAGVCAVAVVLGGFVLAECGGNTNLDKMSRCLQGVSETDNIIRDILYQERAYRNLVIFQDSASVASYLKVLNDSNYEMEKMFALVDSLLQTEAEKAKLRELSDNYHAYSAKGKDFAKLAAATKIEMPQQIYDGLRSLRAEGDAAEQSAHELRDMIDYLAEHMNKDAKRYAGSKIDRMYSKSFLGLSHTGDIIRDILYQARAYWNLVIFQDSASVASYMKAVNDSEDEMEKMFASVDLLLQTEAEKAKHRELRDNYHAYITKGKEFVKLAKATKIEMPQQIYDGLRTLRSENDAAEQSARELKEMIGNRAKSYVK